MADIQAVVQALKAYQPSPRDRIARMFLNAVGDTYDNRKFARNLIGSSGIGGGAANPSGMSLADGTPVGAALGFEEAGAKMGSGRVKGGLADAALMALPVPAIAKGAKGLLKIGERGAAQIVEKAAPIVAYHGSPHTFDKFDASKIGTGEGAQAFGRGLYFAENEATAQAYRKALSGPRDDFDGKIAPELMTALGKVDYLGFDSAAEALSAIRQHPDWSRRWDVPDPRDIQKGFDAHEARKFAGRGSMYEVGINANPEHFLDWDKALSGQHPKVIEALRGAGVEAAGLADRPATGADIYNSLRQARRSYGPDSNGAEALQEAGVPGIRYLDQGSRIAGEGSRNLVVFNPQIVDIMKRYGVAAPVAATMLASGQYGAQAAQQQPVSPVAAAMAASPPAPR